MAKKDSYRIGALYPRVADGSPNLILSSGYQLVSDGSDFVVKQKSSRSSGRLSADLTITTDYDTARQLFVEQDPTASMQAFMQGRIKVEGDITRLMMMQTAIPQTDTATLVAAEIKNITA